MAEHWHGTLLNEKRDESGLLYCRNRYYDPATGRFTQEDPIGLAGEVNVYGFAAGDPVSYADPFGLCPAHLVRADGYCPGGWNHEQYDHIDGIAKNHLTAEASGEIRTMLVNGLIVNEATLDPTSVAETVWGRDPTAIILGPAFFRFQHGGDAAHALGHELGHVKQKEISGLIYGERMDPAAWRALTSQQGYRAGHPYYEAIQRDADRYGCSVAINVVNMRIADVCKP